ncbi:uncharacterized protein LOC144649735 isoform X2 [Oculina patagonica]
MAEDSAEIEPGLLENVQLAIRRNIELAFVKKAKVEFKGDRSEARILALSAHRLYVLTSSKNGCKVDFSMHVLEIQKIESSKPLLLTLLCGEKSHYFRVLQPKDCTEIIAHILASLKTNFPSGNPDRLLRVVYGPPEESDARQGQVSTLVNNLRNTGGDVEVGPCGGFSKVYVSMCDYYGQPHLEEVVWDIDTIYLSLNTKELNIQDFDHLEQKDLIPLISTLEYNDWFTKVTCDSFKLASEVCDAIIRIVVKSSTIEELVLDGVSFGRECCQKLAMALTSNPKTSLHSLSLNGNSIEDRGSMHLAGVFSKLPQGLVALSLADNGITSKGASSLGQALKNNKYNESSLQRLDLSKNPFKGDGIAGLCDFLAKPNMLTYLDLSATECPLDLLFGALIRGCAQQLASIHLAGNSFTSKKTKDAIVPPSFKQFFSSSQALKFLDVSDCKLHAEAVRAILEGLRENSVLCDVELNISNNELRSQGAKAIAENIASLKCVSRLDISDNGFEMDLIRILEKLASNKKLKYLNLGQNTRQRSSSAVMEALVQLISEENSHLESISLAESKLKHDIIPLLDALGTNETLKELDISGNHMGDEGARILAKALQINTKLRTLDLDKNLTTYRGFADIAAALECNHTLLSMPMPLHDAAQSLKPQTEQHLRKIEKLLLRNQSPHKVVTEQAYRLQQGLLLTSTQQQMVDRLVVQLQDLVNELRSSKDPDVKNETKTAKHFIQDADKLKQLLLKFHLCTSDSDIEARFAELANDFYKAAEDKMKSNMDKMIDCAKEVCPYITSADDVKSRLQAVVQGKSSISETFVEEVILTRAAAGIANRLSEDKLTVASIMADTIMEMVIHQLEYSVSKLDLLLKDHRNKMEDKDAETEKSAEEDDVAAVARKARNRLSSAQLTVPATDGTDGPGGRSNKRRPTVNRRPSPGRVPEEDEINNKEEVKVVKVEKEEVERAPPAPSVVTTKVDFTDMETKGSDLKHLVKDRARPPQKRRLPTRPSNRPAVAKDSAQGEINEEEDIEVFWSKTVEEPSVSVTPDKNAKKTSTSKSPPSAVTPPSKTTPPRPATKPKPSPKLKDEENKKSSWMPKGGISLPGFLKKKPSRDRAATAPSSEASTVWHTNNGADKKKASPKEQPKVPKESPPSEKKPEVSKERVPSEKKPEATKERVPSEKKPEETKERVPSEKKPEVTLEKKPSEKEPAVSSEKKEEEPKQTTPSEKIPEVTIEKRNAEENEAVSKERASSQTKRERAPSGGKLPPIMGVKPFALPRDRVATEAAPRPPTAQPRDRASTADKNAAKPSTPEEPAKPRGPPKFGIGIGGAAGGGLLAEMKLRQERAASLGRNKPADKPAESKPPEPTKATTESKEAAPEVTKERLVKPSSFKRPRLPSGTPPKPAPRPDKKKEPKEEKKEETKVEKPEVKKEEKPEEKKVEKPEVKKEETREVKEDKPEDKKEVKPEEKKEEEPDGKKEEEPKKEELDEVVENKEKPVENLPVEEVKKEEDGQKKEETQANEREEKPSKELKEPKEEVKQKLGDVGADTSVGKGVERTEKVGGKVANGETKIKEKDGSKTTEAKDDLWVKREAGKEALRPGGRSMSLKMQRSTSATEKVGPSLRSATLPKPWSPGQAPSSMLSRKLSWEIPKVSEEDAGRGVKKERSGSTTEEPILEVSEDQSSKTSPVASKEEDQTSQQVESKDEAKVTTENGAIPKSPDAATLEQILNSDGDTAL